MVYLHIQQPLRHLLLPLNLLRRLRVKLILIEPKLEIYELILNDLDRRQPRVNLLMNRVGILLRVLQLLKLPSILFEIMRVLELGLEREVVSVPELAEGFRLFLVFHVEERVRNFHGLL
jgi:hypothetical protein